MNKREEKRELEKIRMRNILKNQIIDWQDPPLSVRYAKRGLIYLNLRDDEQKAFYDAFRERYNE